MKNDRRINMPKSFYRTIMMAAAERKPALSTYKKVFEKVEDAFIEYPQFELWYDRLVEKSQVALKMKKKENKHRPRLQFSDLNTDVISRVLDHLDVPSRLATRNASKSLRGLIDSQNPNITSIEFDSLPKLMTVVFVDTNQKTSRFRFHDPNIPRGVYLYRAQQFLAPILKNPKLKLAKLKLKNCLAAERFAKILKAQKSKIHVATLKICSDDLKTLLSLLQYLEPGTLKNLKWNVTEVQNFAKLLETDHWKRLESFKSVGGAQFPAVAGIQNLFHLKSFEVLVNKLSGELLEEFKNNLLSSAHFQSAMFLATDRDFDEDEIPGIFGNLLKIFNITYRIERESQKYYGGLKIQRI